MDQHLQRLQSALSVALSGLSDEQVGHRPEGKWNIAEIAEHLSLSYTGTTKGFDRCFAAGSPLARQSSTRDRLATFLVCDLGYLPEGRTAPVNTRPSGIFADMSPEAIRTRLKESLDALDAAISRCEERYGKGKRLLDHPVIGPLTAAQWRKFHWIHGRHHIKQIERMKGMQF